MITFVAKTSARTGNSCPKNRHRQYQTWLLTLILLFAFSSPVNAQGTDREPLALSMLKFAGGMISAYAFHETGHALAANLTGTKLEWGVGTYNQPLGFTEYAENDNAGLLVHGAGLTTQIICSEIILQSDSIDKNDNFVRGMMFWNIINPVIYALDYWVIKATNYEQGSHYQGDIKGFEHYTNAPTANGFAALMVGMAIFQGYRFAKTQDWAPNWMGDDKVQLNFQSRGSDGAVLTIKIPF